MDKSGGACKKMPTNIHGRVFAFHADKAVVQITAVEMTIDHLLDIGPPEARTVVLFVKRDSFKNTQEKRT
jgi:hypothetical protein